MYQPDGPAKDEPPRGPWSGRVQFSSESDGFAYRPGEVLTTRGEEALEVARRLFGDEDGVEITSGRRLGIFSQLLGVPDPIRLVHELRLRGFVAQPNHVFFAHSCACCNPHPSTTWSCAPCRVGGYASPVGASPVGASPVGASPVYASPVYASPVYASPVYASPVYASDYRATGRRMSSARPATPLLDLVQLEGEGFAGGHQPVVAILDTGLAGTPFRPNALPTTQSVLTTDVDDPDEDGDGLLDPAAGHGTFIAGIIQQISPGCELLLDRVLSTFGDGSELDIAIGINETVGLGVKLLNLSFGGYTLDYPQVMASVIRDAQAAGVIVVASAGNDATCRPTFPAALPGVIGVGALGPNGPAPFTNYGTWVRACAPGVDLISTFFGGFDGVETARPGEADPDKFDGWAAWSGSSFSAPIVVGALARQIINGLSPDQAVERVIDAPWLLRIPDLGTVVNGL